MIFGNDARRFWSKTKIEGSCIVWTGARDRDGYGKFMTGPAGAQKTHRPHRWLYANAIGDPGPILLHSCDNRACVQLQHLEPGTQSQNIRDAVSRGRALVGSLNPFAKLNEEQVDQIRSGLAAGESRKSMADRFGVSLGCIDAIKAGRNWRKR